MRRPAAISRSARVSVSARTASQLADQPEQGRDQRQRLRDIREQAVESGVSLPLLVLVKLVLVPFFKVYLRLQGFGTRNLPRSGPLLLASNHRSFLDPFVIGALVPRPIYYVAKRELFERRWQAWLLGSLGAFPIDRGRSDEEAMATARTILQRGDCVVIFPEGTRIRTGTIGVPRRGVGRLALETGATVVPVAVIGTNRVRRGWRIRPRKVTIRFGKPMRFARTEEVSPSLAAAASGRVWACVELQWQWLGGAPSRRAAERERSQPRGRRASGGEPSRAEADVVRR